MLGRIAKALLERESLQGDELDVLIASHPLRPAIPALALIDPIACVAERNLGLASREVDSAGAQTQASRLGCNFSSAVRQPYPGDLETSLESTGSCVSTTRGGDAYVKFHHRSHQ
jgi:hypothetical protein